MDEKQTNEAVEFDGVSIPARKFKALVMYIMALEYATPDGAITTIDASIFDWEWPELSQHISDSR